MVKTDKGLRAEFNISQKKEKELLEFIGTVIGFSGKVSVKKDGQCILTAVNLEDIQKIINFITDPDRIRLLGLKK